MSCDIFKIYISGRPTRHVESRDAASQYCNDYLTVTGSKSYCQRGNHMNGTRYVYLTRDGEESCSTIVEFGSFYVTNQEKEQLLKQNVRDPIFDDYCKKREDELTAERDRIEDLRNRMCDRNY